MLRSAQIVTYLTVVAQIVGFLRTASIAATLGVSLDVDAYNLGLIVPTFIATIIGGWLQVGFVGRYAGLVATGDSDTATAYRSRILLLVIVITTGTSIAFAAFPQTFLAIFLPAGKEALLGAGAGALRICAIILVPVAVGDLLGLILNCHGKFFVAAAAPVLNALVSTVLLWLWPTVDLHALAWTLVVGVVVQLATVFAAAAQLKLRFTLEQGSALGDVMQTVLIAFPLLPAMALSNSANAILQFRSAELGEGAISVLGYAQRLNGALTQVIVIGFSTVLLPHFASLWALNDRAQIISLLRRFVRAGLFLSLFISLGIYLMGSSAVAVLFQRGAFNEQVSQQVATLWEILSLSLFPLAAGTFIARLCQAMRLPRTILLSSFISFSVTWLVCWIGGAFDSLITIAASSAAASLATACFWAYWIAVTLGARQFFSDTFETLARVVPVLIGPFVLDLTIRSFTASWPPLWSVGARATLYTMLAILFVKLFRLDTWCLARDLGFPSLTTNARHPDPQHRIRLEQ